MRALLINPVFPASFRTLRDDSFIGSKVNSIDRTLETERRIL